MFVKMIMPVRNIPDNSIVTKRTGEKEYIVRHDIKIYFDSDVPKENRKELKADDGCCFLLDKNSGNISVTPDTLEVCVRMSLDELRDWLDILEIGFNK